MKYYKYDQHAYEHDCEKCKFLTSIRREDGFGVDIYRSCEEDSVFPYLIRYSSVPEDYVTVGIEQLAIHYAEVMKGV